jgi:hypothetical protein
VNAQGQNVVEPGEFKILVGASSRNQDLLTTEMLIEYNDDVKDNSKPTRR